MIIKIVNILTSQYLRYNLRSTCFIRHSFLENHQNAFSLLQKVMKARALSPSLTISISSCCSWSTPHYDIFRCVYFPYFCSNKTFLAARFIPEIHISVLASLTSKEKVLRSWPTKPGSVLKMSFFLLCVTQKGVYHTPFPCFDEKDRNQTRCDNKKNCLALIVMQSVEKSKDCYLL